MKGFSKGLLLGISLVILNRLCCILFMDTFDEHIALFISGILFFLITTGFLLSKNIPELLLCGFTGLFTMFTVETVAIAFQLPFYMKPML